MSETNRDVDVGLQHKTVKDIHECICELKTEACVSPVQDGDQSLTRFCSKLELLLQLGLKERLLKDSDDYITFIEECSKTNRSLCDGIKFVKKHKEYQTKRSQGRALIRYGLVHHLLADTIQHCTNNVKVISKYYNNTSSIFYNEKLCQELINDIYDLNNVNFDIDSSVPDLDIQWPLYSRSRHLNSPNASWKLMSSSSRLSITSCTSSLQDESFRCSVDFIGEEISEDDGRRKEDIREEGKNIDPHCGGPEAGILSLEKLKDAEDNLSINQLSSNPVGRFDEEKKQGCPDECKENATEIEELHLKILDLEAAMKISDEVLESYKKAVCCNEQNLDHLRTKNEILLGDANENARKLEIDLQLFVDFLDRVQSVHLSEFPQINVKDEQSKHISESSLDRVFYRFEEKFELPHRGKFLKNSEQQELSLQLESLKNELDKKDSENEKLKLLVNDLEELLTSKENIELEFEEKLKNKEMEEERNLSICKKRVEQLENDLKIKEQESNEIFVEMEEALKSVEAEKNSLIEKMEERIEEAIADKEVMVKELKDDMDIMVGSFKRREILMEKTRKDFEKSIEKVQEEHVDEIAPLKKLIKQLESKISDELTIDKKHLLEEEIGKLDEELMTAREDVLVLRLEFKEKLDVVNNKLENMEEENVSLRNQVSQLSRDGKREFATYKQKENDWSKERDVLDAKIKNLKSNIAQLISDKRNLWEKCQDLIDREDMTSSYKWIDPSKVHQCQLCGINFTLSVRKHHCRRCGNVFCANCNNNWVEAPQSSGKSRICNICRDLDHLNPAQTNHNSSNEEEGDSYLTLNDLSTFGGHSTLNNLDNILDVSRASNDSFADHDADSLLSPEVIQVNNSGGLSTLARLTGGVKNAAVWATSTAVSSIVKTTGHVSGIFVRPQNGIENSVPFIYDDRFEILTPDEINESRVTLPSDDQTIIVDLIDPINDDDDTFELIQEIPSDKLLIIPINLKLQNNRATSMHWSFHSEPKGVTFGISYHGPYTNETKDRPESSTSLTSSVIHSGQFPQINPFGSQRSEVLLSFKKVHSHLRNVSGLLTPKAQGVYAFLFDNTKSSVMTKKISLKIKLIPCSAIPLPTDC